MEQLNITGELELPSDFNISDIERHIKKAFQFHHIVILSIKIDNPATRNTLVHYTLKPYTASEKFREQLIYFINN